MIVKKLTKKKKWVRDLGAAALGLFAKRGLLRVGLFASSTAGYFWGAAEGFAFFFPRTGFTFLVPFFFMAAKCVVYKLVGFNLDS